MYRIVKTTDGKHIGNMIEINESTIPLPGFNFVINKLTYTSDNSIKLYDIDNYLVEVILINELE